MGLNHHDRLPLARYTGRQNDDFATKQALSRNKVKYLSGRIHALEVTFDRSRVFKYLLVRLPTGQTGVRT